MAGSFLHPHNPQPLCILDDGWTAWEYELPYQERYIDGNGLANYSLQCLLRYIGPSLFPIKSITAGEFTVFIISKISLVSIASHLSTCLINWICFLDSRPLSRLNDGWMDSHSNQPPRDWSPRSQWSSHIDLLTWSSARSIAFNGLSFITDLLSYLRWTLIFPSNGIAIGPQRIAPISLPFI